MVLCRCGILLCNVLCVVPNGRECSVLELNFCLSVSRRMGNLCKVHYCGTCYMNTTYVATPYTIYTDASAVLFNSLAAVHITAAERMKQVRYRVVVAPVLSWNVAAFVS